MDNHEYLIRRLGIVEQVLKKVIGYEESRCEWGTDKQQFLTDLVANAQTASDELEQMNNETSDVQRGGNDVEKS